MSDKQEIVEAMMEHFSTSPAQRLERDGNVWQLTPNGVVLVCMARGAARYEVPVEQLKNPKEFCDWLAHLLEKTWCTDRVLADFVRAADLVVGLQ